MLGSSWYLTRGLVLTNDAPMVSADSRGKGAGETRRHHRLQGYVLFRPPSTTAQGHATRCSETTMPNPRLPEETLDHILSHLYDSRPTLKNCCLVSKSWIPRSRKLLFANVSFPREKNLESWKKAFPDHSTSPARYAKTLHIGCSHVLTPADGEPGSWIRGFSRVGHLGIGSQGMLSRGLSVTFVALHGFSPIRSLRATFVILLTLEIFDLILSFPLLEDLAVIACTELLPVSLNGGAIDGLSAIVQPSNPPVFTGSLELSMERGMGPIARRLLSLASGIHFRKLILRWYHEEDPLLTTALVRGCSSTLESLDVTYISRCTSIRACARTNNSSIVFLVKLEAASIDLSNATGLKDLVFRVQSRNVDWVTTALRTITPKHLSVEHISIHVRLYRSGPTLLGTNIGQTVGEPVLGQWPDLDRFLVHFWESRSIRPKVRALTSQAEEKQEKRDRVGLLLPEITARGIIDLIE